MFVQGVDKHQSVSHIHNFASVNLKACSQADATMHMNFTLLEPVTNSSVCMSHNPKNALYG